MEQHWGQMGQNDLEFHHVQLMRPSASYFTPSSSVSSSVKWAKMLALQGGSEGEDSLSLNALAPGSCCMDAE